MGIFDNHLASSVHRSSNLFADQHELPDTLQEPCCEVRFNNHRLMSGELKPHEQSLRFIDIRLMFAHDDKSIRRQKRDVNVLGLGTRLVLVFAPLSVFRTQSDSLYLDGKRAYG